MAASGRSSSGRQQENSGRGGSWVAKGPSLSSSQHGRCSAAPVKSPPARCTHQPFAGPPHAHQDRPAGRTHLGAVLAAGLHQALDDAGVDLEEVVAGHARLAGHARRDDDNVAALERLAQLVLACSRGRGAGREAAHREVITDEGGGGTWLQGAFLRSDRHKQTRINSATPTCVALDRGLAVDVAHVRRHAGGAGDIVQCKLADIG